MAPALGMTPMQKQIELNGQSEPAWQIEMRDLARGFAGALFVSLPLLYTMEMWHFGRSLDIRLILFLLVLGYFGNVGLCAYAGFRQTRWESGYLWDGIACMGIGAVASALTLLVAGIIDFDLSPTILEKRSRSRSSRPGSALRWHATSWEAATATRTGRHSRPICRWS